MKLDDEYSTLRAELLQVYQEQSRLSFVTAVASAAIFFGLLKTPIPTGLGVFVWQLILIGIAWKITSNYKRIYRIGGYLKIVHEMKCDPTWVPKNGEPGWHFRSRKIGKGSFSSWKWGTGAIVDARFLRLLGFAGIVFAVVSLFIHQPSLVSDCSNTVASYLAWTFVYIVLPGVGFAYLWFQTRYLYGLSKESEKFEEMLWEFLNKTSKTPSNNTINSGC